MHTLRELESGQLIGSKTLKLACGLKEFPEEIFSLAETLEILDLSDNQISELPDAIAQLKKLRIIFFARNCFTEFPAILKQCPNLSMIGFKSNQIQSVPENAFPPLLRWLVLTDNKIQKLPKSIGDCRVLQKCALAGNLIEELPSEMANCVNLELLRISANQLTSIPAWLFELPKLSWVAFSGNPASHRNQINTDLASFDWDDFSIKELLGEGASGLISKALWNTKKEEVAIKVFKGDVTSDGLPADEMEAAIAVGSHENLIQVLGEIRYHPEGKSGLILKLIPAEYINLGNPPSLDSCTRDVFDETCVFNGNEILKIAKNIASVCVQLHSKGINHGDLYAHNILVNQSAACLLGDFGAASFYDVNAVLSKNIERIEVRAFGCLLEDLLSLTNDKELNSQLLNNWQKLIADCTLPDVKSRPGFSKILEELEDGLQIL
ncbi:leucine-rich repeat-containing serine/threonine-protein kinase [Reichenbachiella agarivorans]|uniref:Leucine-rich repeat-containing serine/threonine-protein kinase n=1 Tax=Reichenbachiella agarivorans TaxID=2979464 RepID=A0ABY6CVB9_9BACT|nr:leucine-rich repeat-containing protein kinase family protein [Reichenbachiella agarivorans]UXP33343.1 leucine-rich repeat-containing serine/threonine-protein kinase [Reichenbachiella agarivorans]